MAASSKISPGQFPSVNPGQWAFPIPSSGAIPIPHAFPPDYRGPQVAYTPESSKPDWQRATKIIPATMNKQWNVPAPSLSSVIRIMNRPGSSPDGGA
jgi:hypothetical protein